MEETRWVAPEELPYKVKKLENVVIPMKDGCRLYAHIWIPEDALTGNKKVAAVMEYIPYRKNDFTSLRDSLRHPYYGGAGFASIRVDMRGCGDSDETLKDEYLKQEQDDCLEVFDWIVSQKWSNGNIGMFGFSWGGFNGLQLAARQHPALKTIITLMSTDDRYSDDVHYRGGVLFASDMLWWASIMFVYSARPQDPSVVGASWRDNWFQRLNTTPYSIPWITHQTRDDYWKHGSVCENNHQAVQIPVLAVGGWRDGYTSTVFRLVDKLPNKASRGIVGPWVHDYPEASATKPNIGFLQSSVKWWNKWLNPESGDDIDLPPLSAYVQEPSSIEDYYGPRPGKWVGVDYPIQKRMQLNLDTSGKGLTKDIPASSEITFSGTQEHGLFRGTWCPFGQEGDFATEQKIEDGKSLTFDSSEFDEDVDLLGFPELNVAVSSDKPNAILSTRLVDLHPNGDHVLLSWGMLNLSHRDSHEFPEALVPGEKYKVKIQLDAIGIKLEKGHKLRLALSPTDWPSAWPLAETPTLTIYAPETNLTLPYIESGDYKDVVFPKPESMKVGNRTMVAPESRSKKVFYDVITNTWTLENISDAGDKILEDDGAKGIRLTNVATDIWKINPNDPLSAYNQCDHDISISRGDWNTRIITTSNMKADKENFYLYNKLTAFENDKQVFEKVWENTIPRNFC